MTAKSTSNDKWQAVVSATKKQQPAMPRALEQARQRYDAAVTAKKKN